MKPGCVSMLRLLIALGFVTPASLALGASSTSALLEARREAEAKGYIFLTSREEILAKAKSEGKLRLTSSFDAETLKDLSGAFKKKYAFIDVQAQEIGGLETYVRMIEEMKAGITTVGDVNYLAIDYYNQYLPYQKKLDVLGMADHGVLQIPRQMIDPVNRNIIVVSSSFQVVAYNKKLISARDIPDTWEGFLSPEFKGGKFLLDIRAKDVAALVPAWGLEKTLAFSRKIAAQEPVWIRGSARGLTAMVAGEHSLFVGPNFDSVRSAQTKDPTNSLDYKILEPIPTRLLEPEGIPATANHPYAALLWFEFLGSVEAQNIMNKYWRASIFVPGSALDNELRGKKLSIVGWDHQAKMEQYQAKIVEAYGFPKGK